MSASNNAPGARRSFDARSMRSNSDVGRQKHYVVIDFAFATRFRLPRHVHPNVPETALRLANVQGNAQAPARTFRPDQLGTALDVEAALELGLQLPDDRTEHAGEFLTHLLRKVSAREFRSNSQYLFAHLIVQSIDYLGIHPPETFRDQIRPGRHSAKTLGSPVQRVDQSVAR